MQKKQSAAHTPTSHDFLAGLILSNLIRTQGVTLYSPSTSDTAISQAKSHWDEKVSLPVAELRTEQLPLSQPKLTMPIPNSCTRSYSLSNKQLRKQLKESFTTLNPNCEQVSLSPTPRRLPRAQDTQTVCTPSACTTTGVCAQQLAPYPTRTSEKRTSGLMEPQIMHNKSLCIQIEAPRKPARPSSQQQFRENTSSDLGKPECKP